MASAPGPAALAGGAWAGGGCGRTGLELRRFVRRTPVGMWLLHAHRPGSARSRRVDGARRRLAVALVRRLRSASRVARGRRIATARHAVARRADHTDGRERHPGGDGTLLGQICRSEGADEHGFRLAPELGLSFGRRVAHLEQRRGGRGRVAHAVLEAAFDHLEGEEVLALLAEDPAEAIDVGLVELAVTGRRPLGNEQPPALEETDLRDRHVRKLLTQQRENVANGQVGALPHWNSALARREENELELAHLDFVSAFQRRSLDPLPVDICAVQRPDVGDDVVAGLAAELGVPAGHRHVVQEDLAVGMPADPGDLARQHVPRPGVRTALDDQNSGPVRQFSCGNADLVIGRITGRIFRGEGDRRIGGWQEGRAARRAEIRLRRVPVAAVVAEHSSTVDQDLRCALKGLTSSDTSEGGAVTRRSAGPGHTQDDGEASLIRNVPALQIVDSSENAATTALRAPAPQVSVNARYPAASSNSSNSLGSVGFDDTEPALAVGIGVDALGLVGQGGVDLRHRPADRRVDLGDGLGGLDLAELAALVDGDPDGRELDEDDVAEGILCEVGEPDSDLCRPRGGPTRGRGCI